MMRFLGGLLTGGLITLLVAIAFDVPTDGIVDRAKTQWLEFTEVAGGSLPGPSGGSQTVGPEAVPLDTSPDRMGGSPALDHSSVAALGTEAQGAEPVVESAAQRPRAALDTRAVVSLAGQQAVWVPFRSRSSAQGFAEHLTAMVGHGFRVEREGPGRYQVVFGYVDGAERQSVLERVQLVTDMQP